MRYLTTEKQTPVFYTRYVDDIFCIFRKGEDFQPFLNKLNNLHPNLAFTHEIGGTSLPFLDINIELKGTELHSSIYRKKTDTGVILHYSSTAPKAWKSALIKWFITRADRLCSHETLYQKEVEQLRTMFYNNGYPLWFFEKELSKYRRDKVVNNNDVIQTPNTDGVSISGTATDKSGGANEKMTENRIWCKIPYVGRPSLHFGKRIKALFRGIMDNIKIVYTTAKVRDYFSNKDITPKPFLSQVVYQFTCLRDADTKYVGFTNRKLQHRAHEHLRTGTTAIGDHISSCNECANGASLDNFNILKKCRNATDSKIFEALLIKKINPSLNISLKKPGATWTLKVFH